jgi:hypothetical protein
VTPLEQSAQVLAEAAALTERWGRYGPSDAVEVEPSREADLLADALVRRAFEALRRAFDARRPIVSFRTISKNAPGQLAVRQPTGAELPAEPQRHASMVGLPLSLSILPAIQEAAELILIRRLEPWDRQAQASELGWELVRQENSLWRLASLYGSGTGSTMPYACRVRALRWWWEPALSRDALCLRCGCDIVYRRKRRLDGLALCGLCLKRRQLELPHAIAPAGRGTWWITCQAVGCSIAFVARAHARYCPDHKASSLTPSRRHRGSGSETPARPRPRASLPRREALQNRPGEILARNQSGPLSIQGSPRLLFQPNLPAPKTRRAYAQVPHGAAPAHRLQA